MTSILAAARSAGSTGDAGAGTLVALAIIAIWLYALRGKGNVSSRFAGIIAVFIGGWLLLGVHSVAGAGAIAAGLLHGLSAILSLITSITGGH